MERHPAGCDPEAFRRLPAPPPRRPMSRTSFPTATPRAPSYNIPRQTRPQTRPRPRSQSSAPHQPPRLRSGFSPSLEDAIISVCNIAPSMRSGFPAIIDYRKRKQELENRFIAHVAAELRRMRSNEDAGHRSNEDAGQRHRSSDSDYQPETEAHRFRDTSRKRRRASVGEVISSTGRPRRSNARRVPMEMLEEEVEAVPLRDRLPRRSKQAVINLDDDYWDAKFAPDVLDGLTDTRGSRSNRVRASPTTPGRVVTEVYNVDGSVDASDRSTHNDDTDETENHEEAFSIPIVRPKPFVRKRALWSDKMSLTPIITEDDEGTDTEELRKALARRPTKKRKPTGEETALMFSGLPRPRHRLGVDHMVVLPTTNGILSTEEMPIPSTGISTSRMRPQIVLYPLPNLSEMPQERKLVDLHQERIEPRPVQASLKKIQQKQRSTDLALEGRALPNKTIRKGQTVPDDVPNVAGIESSYENGPIDGGIQESSSQWVSSAVPVGRGTALETEKTTLKKSVAAQKLWAGSKPAFPKANQRPVPAPPRHRPPSEAVKTQGPQTGPPHSHSLFGWKSPSQPRVPHARAPQAESFLAYKSPTRSIPAAVSPAGVKPPARIRSPETPSSRIPTPTSVFSRRTTPGTNVGSAVFPASSRNARTSLGGNNVTISAEGNVSNPMNGRSAMRSEASDSTSCDGPKQRREALRTREAKAVAEKVQGGDNVTATVPNESGLSPHSAGTADAVNIASASNGHVSEEEKHRYERFLDESSVDHILTAGTPGRLSGTQQMQHWNSTLLPSNEVVPTLDSPVVSQSTELVVRNSAMGPHGVSYTHMQSQTPSSAYGMPAYFGGPRGAVTGVPAQMMGMHANIGGGVALPCDRALVNGGIRGNMDPRMACYPSVAGGTVFVHQYPVNPEAMAAMMGGLNSSQLSHLPGYSRERPVPSQIHDQMYYNGVYKQQYMELERRKQKNADRVEDEDAETTKSDE